MIKEYVVILEIIAALERQGIKYLVSNDKKVLEFSLVYENEEYGYEIEEGNPEINLEDLLEELEKYKKENIKVEGRTGTWYEIRREYLESEETTFFVMESEQYGEDTEHIVINKWNIEASEEISYEVIYGEEL